MISFLLKELDEQLEKNIPSFFEFSRNRKWYKKEIRFLDHVWEMTETESEIWHQYLHSNEW